MPNKNKKAAPKMRSSMEMRSAMEMKTPMEMRSPMDMRTPMEMRSAMEMNSPMESNKFFFERQKAIDAGKDTFTINGEVKKVTGEKSASEMRVSPNQMGGSPYKMYGQDVSPNTMQGGSPLAKYGITTK